jgi:hypothetical protein
MTPDQVKAEKPPRDPPPRRRRQPSEELLDEALAATFPASDPVAIIQPAPAKQEHESH